MIQLIPKIKYDWQCPYCLSDMSSGKLVWQGIHVGISSRCKECGEELVADLPIGHAQYDSYIADPQNNRLFGPYSYSRIFFGLPFLKTLQNPNSATVPFQVIKKQKNIKEAVVVCCLDYLYGHCLLKLFNVQRHLKKELPVIVIVPNFLVWAVPKEVAEIWNVSLSLSQMKEFYSDLHQKIESETKRFKTLFIGEAYSHPNRIDIKQFTQTATHDWQAKDFRITFIWREDRPWFFSFPISYLFRKLKIISILLWWQNWQVVWMMSKIKKQLPQAQITVAGIGTSTQFPQWIQDLRVEKPTESSEKKLCNTYSESRVVIGVHGSSMLLPSAHAGAMINLLPSDRLGNFGQDVMYHPLSSNKDPRIISFLYRYLPITTTPLQVATQAVSIVKFFSSVQKYFHTTT